jgi:hypothetical protein
MSTTQTEFDWYCREIERERKVLEGTWALYSASRTKLDRLERDRHTLFQKLMQNAEARAKRYALNPAE